MFFFLYLKGCKFFSELNLKNCRETPTSIQRPTGQYKFAIFGNPAKKNLKRFSTTCIVFAIQKTNAFVLYFRKKYIWVSSWYFHIHFFFHEIVYTCHMNNHKQFQNTVEHAKLWYRVFTKIQNAFVFFELKEGSFFGAKILGSVIHQWFCVNEKKNRKTQYLYISIYHFWPLSFLASAASMGQN